MIKDTELKPCPFCGGIFPTVHMYQDDHFPKRWVVHCQTCNITRKGMKRDEAITAWNTRAEPFAAHRIAVVKARDAEIVAWIRDGKASYGEGYGEQVANAIERGEV